MLTKAQIKHLQGLKLKKYRQNYGDFVIEGEKLVTEALLENVFPDLLIATPDWLEAHKGRLPEHIAMAEATQADIAKISSLSTPQPVLALVKKQTVSEQDIVVNGKWSIALDGISDPGNLGTIIRTADWFGVDTIICSTDCVELYNPKVVQSTMGSLFRVQVLYTDLSAFLSRQHIPKYAAVLGGTSLFQQHLSKEGILVIGSESHGISAEVQKKCTQTVTIPSYGRCESLNAAVAASVILSEVRRSNE